jgi:predicted nucleotidyltransferase
VLYSPKVRRAKQTSAASAERRQALLAALGEALEAEPSVSVAVVFGSVVKETDTEGSDLDLVVKTTFEEDWEQRAEGAMEVTLGKRRLRERLEAATGKKIDLFLMGDMESEPAAWLGALQQSLVVVDKIGFGAGLETYKEEMREKWRARGEGYRWIHRDLETELLGQELGQQLGLQD